MRPARTPAPTPEPDADAGRSARAAEPRAERILALQRSAGNRAVSRMLARQATVTPPAAPLGPPIVTRDVDREISETISHAPASFSQWNGTFAWRAKWQLRLDKRAEIGQLQVVVRLHSTASDAVKRAWTRRILSKWSNKFAFVVLRERPVQISPGVTDDNEEMYPIRIRIDWVDDPARAHYVIRANAATATEGGRAGVGGTTSMTGWGTADTVDITHEFGHMLGCPEEYFTTNGVDYTYGGRRAGFRDPRGGVMNNPAGPALARNFALIRREAAALRRIPLRRTRIRPWR
jgi:hypothetical protein